MNPTTTTEAGAVADVVAIARGLSVSQKRLVLALDRGWKLPHSIIPNGTAAQMANRDARLIERRSEAAGNPYRLTPLGLAVRQHLEQGATAGVPELNEHMFGQGSNQ